MANLSKMKRDKLLGFINKLKEQNNDDESIRSLNEIANALSEKKYGLVWEKHTEQVDEMLEHNIPVFEEVETNKIKVDESNDYNFLLEGDNLHSLKLLQKNHKGKIDVIYIDPPYNTGNKDFIYNDSYVDKADGYAHSKWLSFMNERLELAKELLSTKGVIFISIDDNEQAQLKLLCDEVFGEGNFISTLIWAAGRKNDSKYVSVSHEYILCYVKSLEYLKENKIVWRERKQGIDDIYKEYKKLKKSYGNDYKTMSLALKQWYKNLPQNHPAKNHKHYNCIDENGIYFPSDISWPGGGGPKYEILHPKTRKPVSIPNRGWVYPTKERMEEIILQNLVHFGDDETSVPCKKTYLSQNETSTPYSVFYKDGRAATKRLRSLMGKNVFQNPKDEEVIKSILAFTTTHNSTILDFFAGSGTTGHAVMQLNKEDGGNRKYILCTNNENNICEEVTYRRLKNIQDDLPHNLKYFKTNFIPKIENEEDTITAKLIDHIIPLIELEYMCEIDNKNKLILLDEHNIAEVIQKAKDEATIFISNDVFIDGEYMEAIEAKKISLVTIPDYYFKNELMEVGEL